MSFSLFIASIAPLACIKTSNLHVIRLHYQPPCFTPRRCLTIGSLLLFPAEQLSQFLKWVQYPFFWFFLILLTFIPVCSPEIMTSIPLYSLTLLVIPWPCHCQHMQPTYRTATSSAYLQYLDATAFSVPLTSLPFALVFFLNLITITVIIPFLACFTHFCTSLVKMHLSWKYLFTHPHSWMSVAHSTWWSTVEKTLTDDASFHFEVIITK